MTPRRAGRAVAGLTALTLGAGTVLGAAPAAYSSGGEKNVDCISIEHGHQEGPFESDWVSEPLEALGIEQAHAELRRRGVAPGQGVRVAVVDSGVAQTDRIDVSARMVPGAPVNYHGSAVAGLIAGDPRPDGKLIGIAPEATIVDVRVYDSDDPAKGRTPDTDGLAQGLQWLLANRGSFDIVNISLRFGHVDRVQDLVRKLWKAGKIVVASSGNRPLQGESGFDDWGTYVGSEDVRDEVFPAGYDEVVAVAAEVDESEQDPQAVNLANGAIDVSAPTANAVSFAMTGETCVLRTHATSWAAAEVSGVLALLKSAYPQETNAQLVSRLVNTASGRPDVRGTFRGAGVVQPLAAITRPLAPGADGEIMTTTPTVTRSDAVIPPEEEDVLAETRGDAVWWGILGGGALLLAMVLRPLFARRR